MFELMRRHLGRRGAFLVLGGVLWAAYGLSVLLAPLPERFTEDGPGADFAVLNSPWWALLWLIGGIWAVIVGFVRVKAHRSGATGFVALMSPPLIWLVGYAWSFGLWLVTQDDGHERAWVGGLTWIIVVFFVQLIADWPDPQDPATRRIPPLEHAPSASTP